jgi:hypothetical protein
MNTHDELLDHIEPGSLVRTTALLDLIVQAVNFTEHTGLTADEVVLSSRCAAPLPAYPAQWPDGHRRWPNLRPEALRHPLMWLPPCLTDPLHDGRLDRDVWAMRVAIDMEARGVYDPSTGRWTDVLAAHGLDHHDASTRDRLARWLDGAPDDVLDRVELPPSKTPTDDDALRQRFIDAVASLAWRERISFICHPMGDDADTSTWSETVLLRAGYAPEPFDNETTFLLQDEHPMFRAGPTVGVVWHPSETSGTIRHWCWSDDKDAEAPRKVAVVSGVVSVCHSCLASFRDTVDGGVLDPWQNHVLRAVIDRAGGQPWTAFSIEELEAAEVLDSHADRPVAPVAWE